MNQRSVSAIRKLKTDLAQDTSFEKKITKAIQQKKTIISKMTGPKCQTYRLPSYRVSHPHHPNNQVQQNITVQQKKQPKAIILSSQMIKQCIQANKLLDEVCMFHANKKGVFQDKQNKNNIFCHECAIKMVKSNIKVVTLSEQTVMLKHLLHNQLQEIEQQQKTVNQIIHNYYNQIRNTLSYCYSKYIQQKIHNPQIILFKQFQKSTDKIQNLVQHLGKIEEIKFKIIQDQNKQNLSERNKQRLSTAIYNSKEDLQSNIKQTINHSVQQSNSSFRECTRSRQNSYYMKGEKHQKRKILNLR